jgi:hypothetical protein
VTVQDFEARRSQKLWMGLRAALPEWDAMITEFNHEVGAEAAIR